MSAIRFHDGACDERGDEGADVGLGAAVTATEGDGAVTGPATPLQLASAMATANARKRMVEMSGHLLDDDRRPIREHLGDAAHQLGRVVAHRHDRVRALLAGMREHQVVGLLA